MGKKGIRFLLAILVLSGMAFFISRVQTSKADDDLSASLIGSWRGTRHGVGNDRTVRHNLVSFMPGGAVIEAGPSVYATGASFGNGTFLETTFIETWVSEGHGNFVAHLISNIQEAPRQRAHRSGLKILRFGFTWKMEKTARN